MIVVAVQNFNIDAGLSHLAREQAELTGHVLLQSLNEHFPFLEDLDPGSLESPTRGSSVCEEEMGNTTAIHNPGPTSLNAHPGATQSLSHRGESSRFVFKNNCQILHDVTPSVMMVKCVNPKPAHTVCLS